MERIALIGSRGSGKSTVGPFVAGLLGWEFIDADAVLEAEAGRNIVAIFNSDGEAAFRALEERNLKSLLGRNRIVLATGGGVILRESNRALLKANAFTVWLDAPPALCWKRIEADALSQSRRPNLAGGGLEEAEKLITERRPLYQSTAHLTLDAAHSPEELANAIFAAWTGNRHE